MNPVSALLLILSGSHTFARADQGQSNNIAQYAVRLGASIITVFGALRLLEVVAGWDIGIDQLAFSRPIAGFAERELKPDGAEHGVQFSFSSVAPYF